MSDSQLKSKPARRTVLSLGTAFASSLMLTRPLKADDDDSCPSGGQPTSAQRAVAKKIEAIIQAQGMWSDGLFQIEIDRDDIDNVMLNGVPILPSFQINGTVYFQFLDESGDNAIMNGDIPLKPSELDPFIETLIDHDLVFQAEHQHFYDFSPMVWFVHYRRTGDPMQTAHDLKAALSVTSTPFPQTSPSNPTTPLPADKLGDILGATPQIGANGVVNIDVPRANPIHLAGICVNPYLNIANQIAFEPLDNSGTNAAAVIDFSFVAHEINPVVKLMRHKGWDIGCLYNQETDEHPQLFFSHQFKTGDPVKLAHEMRDALNMMNVKFD